MYRYGCMCVCMYAYLYIYIYIRCGVLMSTGNSPESLSRQVLVGIILVGRLGVTPFSCSMPPSPLSSPDS